MTGIDYPKVTLGGTEYEIKFTRATLYKMGKLGVKFNPQVAKDRISLDFAQLIDVLHLAIGFQGTPEELAELAYDERHKIVDPLVGAWAKVVLPSMQIPAPAANTPVDQPTVN